MSGKLWILLMLQPLLPGGCSTFEPKKGIENMVIDKSMAGKTLQVTISQAFRIELDEIPTSGYRWAFSNPEAIPLDILNDTFESRATGIGGGGKHRFECALREKGQYKIALQLCRPWNKAEALEWFEFTVDVR